MVKKLLTLSILLLSFPFVVSADPILETNMVGDTRDGIPDNLVVAVTVDDNGNGQLTRTEIVDAARRLVLASSLLPLGAARGSPPLELGPRLERRVDEGFSDESVLGRHRSAAA